MADALGLLDLFLGGRVPPIQDRELTKKSQMRFMYPKAGEDRTGEIGTGVIITLPFFENISITESQTPRWSKHDILGRNGQLFTFTGSQSRSINLSFTMTMPHIKESNPHPAARYISGSEDAKSAVRESMRESLNVAQQIDYANPLSSKSPAMDPAKSDPGPPEPTFGKKDDFSQSTSIKKKHAHTISITKWWINVIRTSTLNNGQDPRLGPPVIMLKHGPLYQDAKFICQKYEISFDENAGYDLESLLNRRILVSMDLLEVKFGNGYLPGDVNKGDALTGWQDLLDYGMMDPNNDKTPPRGRHTTIVPDVVDPYGQPYKRVNPLSQGQRTERSLSLIHISEHTRPY